MTKTVDTFSFGLEVMKNRQINFQVEFGFFVSNVDFF